MGGKGEINPTHFRNRNGCMSTAVQKWKETGKVFLREDGFRIT